MSYLSLDSYENSNNFKLQSSSKNSGEKSLNIIFKEYTNIKDNEIQKLLNVKRPNGLPVLKLESDENDKDMGFIFETIGMINNFGFEKTYEFVSSKSDINEKTILSTFIFDSQVKKFKEDTVKLRTKIKINSSGIFTCTKCGSKETSYTSKQLRSGDEAETFIIACNACGFTFRK
jgi:DNA-directed RNA polymerase subunit M/transcription elongation factor TFIIS